MTTAADSSNETWHRVHLPVGGWAVPVDVRPPQDRMSIVRQYPVPASNEHGPLLISARVLYTRGLTGAERPPASTLGANARHRSEAPFKNWFVKAFWCATPDEARWLLAHFKQQSNDILDANTSLGGAALRPPWAVTPVWVVAATGLGGGQGLTTTLGADAEGILDAPDHARLWTWFGITDNPQPENCFLVLTRHLPNAMPFVEARDVPRTDQLQELEAVGRGLDACHRSGIAHCDVKPDNIRVHSVGAVNSFVLVDADAVLRLNSRPVSIRLTLGYTHPALGTTMRQGRAVTADQLMAHDRYGFALVAVGAVAGTATTDALIGRVQRDGLPITGDEVRAALRGAWNGDWARLIDALAAPFDEPFDRFGNWSCYQWVEDVLAAQSGAGPAAATAPAPGASATPVIDDELVRRNRNAIVAVRNRLPAALTAPSAPEAVVAAADDVASDLAWRRFTAARWPWALGLPAVALLLVLTIIRDVLL